MLYKEIIAVCSEIHKEHINTLCGQNGKLLNFNLKEAIPLCYYKFNLFIVILQYVFRQHNNIRINVLLQHVSTQESHRQRDDDSPESKQH